jgi:hypothetical protein
MPRKKPTLDCIDYIEWWDHTSHGQVGWKSKEDMDGLDVALCKSVGFVLKENKKSITLVASLADDDMDGEVCIIKSCIKTRERLRG